jgi:carbamate kinase
VALGGNALLRRDQPLTPENQVANIRGAVAQLVPIAAPHRLVPTHGNGAQLGLLALQSESASGQAFSLDVLGAQADGIIGYLLEQELTNVPLSMSQVATHKGGSKTPKLKLP